MDEKDLKELLAEARNEIPSKVYKWIIGIILVVFLFLAGTGVFFLITTLNDYNKNLEFYKSKIESYDKQIAENAKKMEELDKERKELQDDVNKYKQQYNEISYNYSNLIKEVNKPLSPAAQDDFFFSRGYKESYYMNDGGRRFSLNNTTKLQVQLVEREEFKEQKDNLLLTNNSLNDLVRNDLNQIATLKDTVNQFDEKEQQYKKQIITIQKDNKKKMYKRILYGFLIGTAAGYTGHSIQKH